ncbi:SRPBCC domain-containing protein [Paraglaciecola sp.]|uniref:SRPBCC domain-containing protein n=1 Tax=Paraglaciecola sp. TaxID=1920173 RepID=UPI003EF29B40
MKKISGSILLLCFGLINTHAKAEVLQVSEHGFIVENTIQTDKKPEVVWAKLVKDIDKWWPKDHSWWGDMGKLSIQAYAGGCFCEVSDDKSAEHMRISFVNPNKTLRMTGGLGPLQGMGMYGALNWVLSEQEQKTQVTLTYRVTGINPEGFEKLAPIVDRVQSIQLNELKKYLEKRP